MLVPKSLQLLDNGSSNILNDVSLSNQSFYRLTVLSVLLAIPRAAEQLSAFLLSPSRWGKAST